MTNDNARPWSPLTEVTFDGGHRFHPDDALASQPDQDIVMRPGSVTAWGWTVGLVRQARKILERLVWGRADRYYWLGRCAPLLIADIELDRLPDGHPVALVAPRGDDDLPREAPYRMDREDKDVIADTTKTIAVTTWPATFRPREDDDDAEVKGW